MAIGGIVKAIYDKPKQERIEAEDPRECHR